MDATPSQWINQAFKAIAQGGDPNACLGDLVSDPWSMLDLEKSLLHNLLEHHDAPNIQKALSLGATTECRDNQPYHLMVVVTSTVFKKLRSASRQLPEEQRDTQHLMDDLFNNLVCILHSLAAHGVQCTPSAIEQHQCHPRVADNDLYGQQPLLPLLLELLLPRMMGEVNTSTEAARIIAVLMDLGADPWSMASDWDRYSPLKSQWRQKIDPVLMGILAQQEHDHLSSHIDTTSVSGKNKRKL